MRPNRTLAGRSCFGHLAWIHLLRAGSIACCLVPAGLAAQQIPAASPDAPTTTTPTTTTPTTTTPTTTAPSGEQTAPKAVPAPANGKAELAVSIAAREAASWSVAQQIWELAEPGYQEVKSSALLSKMLEEAEFRVERGVAGIPTAFTATYGEGKPVIGLLGEFDALPGLSQQATPVRAPREGATYGHGCGHHLFGVASASAAIAVAEQIKAGRLSGTVRYYGCPAEEGGGAKVFMVLAGLFKDCDAVFHWHPGSRNAAGDRSSLARMAVKFRFHGKSAHAAGAPEQGRSALDAVELTNHAAELMREHTPERTRIHHVITAGGDAPNVVPAFAEVYYYIRHPNGDVVRDLYRRLELCAQGAALATETRLETRFEGGIMELFPNVTLAKVAMDNLKALNDIEYSEEDRRFALKLQESLDAPLPLETIRQVEDRSGTIGMGSTDVGDVSWVVPTSGFSTACWAPGTPAHSWQAVACGGTPIARKGMDLAARVLAAGVWDLMSDPKLITQAQAEHRQRLDGREYRTLMLPGQKPPLDYRKPSRR
ncbi:MAG: amidohydrolase [Planctomycetales bacterium]|nr:amidohydrolase [Planctomycetales bacterium]